jgi:hypothetical protein
MERQQIIFILRASGAIRNTQIATKAKIPFMDFINGLVDREGHWINIWIERIFVCQGGMLVLSSLRYETRSILC